MTTIMLVDDRELFREGFRLLLQSQADFQVITEVATPPEAYQQITTLEPDVAIVSAELQGVSGGAITRELVRRAPRSNVLILAARHDDDGVHHALAAGARGIAL
jgi:DNA-binding NarL/FixJ family response regulator